MEKFVHFFEFFAGVNAVYIVSNDFLDILFSKVNKHYPKLREEVKLLFEMQKELAKKFETQILNSPINDINTFQLIAKKSDLFKLKVEAFNKDLETSSKKNSQILLFNYWCLYAALYCILMLFLNGFSFDINIPTQSSAFAVFNVLSILSIAFIILNKKFGFFPKFGLTYNKVAFAFLINVAISLIVYFINVPWLNAHLVFFSPANLCASLFITVFHFILLSTYCIYISKKEGNRLFATAYLLRRECENLFSQIDASSGLLNELINYLNH